VSLLYDYSIEGVTPHHQDHFCFRRKTRASTSADDMLSQGAGMAGAVSKRATLTRISGRIIPIVLDGGVILSFKFAWMRNDQWEGLEENVFVEYQGTTTRTNGQLTLRAYFESNKTVEPTRAQSGASGPH
jgi:hypothetical protein